ncbi:molybdopterin-dependent oxidoreductase [Bacillus sp. B15-48]|uniref:molybdopterin-dependent oxidoreductase n=1 Tax=Bacillus sp. B15-48 TaxID=1548601 RepID=UPI00193F337A|nr:molybdopterin-dependent oxidoreductase [Bacillus sp. B15-48]
MTEQFFASIGEFTRIIDSSSSFESFEAMGIESGVGGNPLKIREASIIIISGANPAATNIHLIPFIIEAKVKGAKVVVIDPLYTQTAELVDLFIQVRPGGDGILAGLLLKRLLEAEVVAGGFVDGKDHLCPKNFYG